MKRGKTVAPPRCPDWATPVVVEVVECEAPPVVEGDSERILAWNMHGIWKNELICSPDFIPPMKIRSFCRKL